MKRLIEKGLMFGNLIEVSSPALVDRYKRAMKALTGHVTQLADFHIDLSGYSPEIGEELDDDRYLNPNGCNRQFILLTTEQKTAPLLNMVFSTTKAILQRFIERNESQLFALTARDAVVGSVQGSIYEISSLAKLLDVQQVTVEADTLGGHVAAAAQLGALIGRFRTEPESWRDDVLIAEMIELAKKTGDVIRVPISLPALTVAEPSFWTSLFGGVYLLRDVKFPGLITVAGNFGTVPNVPVLNLGQRNEIADWLERNGLVEPIVKAREMDAAAVIRQKMDFILVDAADQLKLDIGDARRTDLRKVAYTLGDALPAEFQGLSALLRWVEGAGDWPRITSEHPAYFYSLRAAAGKNRDLVNMLLAELTPLDVRQMFIAHKELFYASYSKWSDRKKTYVADYLERDYKGDPLGVQQALFGPGPATEGAKQASTEAQDLVKSVGPWGALERGRR